MAKRGNNEGSIYRRSDGRWVAALTLPGSKRRSLYAKTRQEVARKLAAALRDRDAGLPVTPERQMVGQFLTHWLEESVRHTVRPSTHSRYAELVRIHAVPMLGHKSLARLTPQDIQGLYTHTLGIGLSRRTVEQLHAVLRRALGQAFKWGLVARNVATLVDVPRPRRIEIRPLSPEQARTLIGATQGHRMEALYVLCLTVGLRQGEALGLRWGDVDLETGMLHVRSSLHRVNGQYEFVEPKTDRSRRAIALSTAALSALGRHQERQHIERLQAGPLWEDWGLVFTTALGKPLNRHNVTRDFKALLRKADLPCLRFHDLRHTCASLLLSQNVHARVVMEVLGHSQIGLTMNTYAHVMPAAQREAATQMDTILGN